jgi:SOS-response transcriptional repressor LexA
MTPTTTDIPSGLIDFLASCGVTPRQKDVAEQFYLMVQDNGYAPTFNEMGDALGISKVGISEHVEYLIQKGVMGRGRKWRARSLYLLWKPPADGADLVAAARVAAERMREVSKWVDKKVSKREGAVMREWADELEAAADGRAT